MHTAASFRDHLAHLLPVYADLAHSGDAPGTQAHSPIPRAESPVSHLRLRDGLTQHAARHIFEDKVYR